MRSAIFDLDGTLADTSADLIAAVNAGFEADWLDPVADAALALRGGRAMLRVAFDRAGIAEVEPRVEAAFPAFIERYAAGIDRRTVLFPGVVDALDRLAAERWLLGVCTNKPFALAEDLLRRLGIRDRFAALLGADSLPVRKPDPSHYLETVARAGGTSARSVLIGDTETDAKTAAAAGVPYVQVTFGPSGAAIPKPEPTALFAHYDELPGLLDRLVPAG